MTALFEDRWRRVQATATKRTSDTLFVFVMTTGTIHRLRIYRIDFIEPVRKSRGTPLHWLGG